MITPEKAHGFSKYSLIMPERLCPLTCQSFTLSSTEPVTKSPAGVSAEVGAQAADQIPSSCAFSCFPNSVNFISNNQVRNYAQMQEESGAILLRASCSTDRSIRSDTTDASSTGAPHIAGRLEHLLPLASTAMHTATGSSYTMASLLPISKRLQAVASIPRLTPQ